MMLIFFIGFMNEEIINKLLLLPSIRKVFLRKQRKGGENPFSEEGKLIKHYLLIRSVYEAKVLFWSGKAGKSLERGHIKYSRGFKAEDVQVKFPNAISSSRLRSDKTGESNLKTLGISVLTAPIKLLIDLISELSTKRKAEKL